MKPEIDFDYVSIAISVKVIPFLFSIFILYNIYNFALQWKLITEEKKAKLSVTDFYILLFASFLTLTLSFFYQALYSQASKFLSATLELDLYIIFVSVNLVFAYRAFKSSKESIPRYFKLWFLFTLLLCISCIGAFNYQINKYKESYDLNVFEAVYYYFFALVAVLLVTWAGVPKDSKAPIEK